MIGYFLSLGAPVGQKRFFLSKNATRLYLYRRTRPLPKQQPSEK